MISYGDPELLVAQWIHDTLAIETCADPVLPASWRFDTPVAHVQRGAGLRHHESHLTIDDVTLDVDTYAANADDARKAAADIWSALTLQLPETTFSNGIFVKHVAAYIPPLWAPDTGGFRRTAAYRVILHGFATA